MQERALQFVRVLAKKLDREIVVWGSATTPHHEASMVDGLENGDPQSFGPEIPHLPARGQREQETLQNIQNMEGNPNEVLNERAVAVMQRMSDKLTGRDFVQVIPPYLHPSPGPSAVQPRVPLTPHLTCLMKTGKLLWHRVRSRSQMVASSWAPGSASWCNLHLVWKSL